MSKHFFDNVISLNKIGVGEQNPFHNLEVSGSIKATGSFTDGTLSLYHGSITGVKTIQATNGSFTNLYGNATNLTGISSSSILNGKSKIECIGGGSNEDIIKFYTSNDCINFYERMRINKNGNLGVGVNSPSNALEVLSESTQQKWSYNSSKNATMTIGSTGATTLANSVDNITLDSKADIVLDAEGNNITMKANDTHPLDFSNSSGSWTIKNETNDGNIIFNVNDGGSDTEAMRIVGSDATIQPVKFRITANAGSNKVLTSDASGNATWQTISSGSTEKITEGHAKVECFENTSPNNDYITFQTSGDTSPYERMRIDKDGKVGIGVNDPDTTLEIFSTSTQQKWSYDDSNYSTMAVASTGASTIANSGGDITLDSAGDISLDAGGDNFFF